MTAKKNGGMKVISSDGTRVLDRNDPAICAVLLSELKTATNVEIVSTGSANSLVVRVTFRDNRVALRDDVVDEHGHLMQGDARWLPTTGNPIREVILKCVVVSPEPLKYTYDRPNDKNATTVNNLRAEYKTQHRVFDETKHRFPICPDVIALLDFPDRNSFEAVFFNKTDPNPIYKPCRVFNKLRQYVIPKAPPAIAIAMIVMESIPASYKPLSDEALREHPSLVSQVCAMNVVLFHTCKLIALDAHLDNWLHDDEQPEHLRVRLIDFGLSLDITDELRRSQVIRKYFEMHPDELPAYLRLMGHPSLGAASAAESPSEVMQRAILSAAVPSVPLTAWVHKILVISMLIDGIFNMVYSQKKRTCQMSHIFNRVYNDACVTMRHALDTMWLDLNEQLKKDPGCNAMLEQIADYFVRNGYLPPSQLASSAALPPHEEYMGIVPLQKYHERPTFLSDDEDKVGMPSSGGNKSRNPRKTRKTRKTRKLCRNQSRRRQRRPHAKAPSMRLCI